MEIQPGQWIPVLLAFAAVALMVLTLALLWEWIRERSRHRELKRRMDPGRKSSGGETIDDLFKRSEDRGGGLFGPFTERLPHIYDLQVLLDQADLRWHFGTFIILTLGAVVAFGTAGMLFTKFPLVAIGTGLLGGTFPYLFVRWKKRKRMTAFLERFPDAIDLLGRSIRAGHAFSTGLQMVAEETGEPVAGEFRRVFEEQKFGLPLDETLFGLADRIDLVDVQIFVTAVLIQREVGGNLAEILDTLADTIRERFVIERQVRVYTAQGRLTGYLLAVLPLALAFVIYTFNAEYITILVEEPIGRVLIAMAAVMQILGFFTIRRIVDIKV
jgi:tight adherence protein B